VCFLRHRRGDTGGDAANVTALGRPPLYVSRQLDADPAVTQTQPRRGYYINIQAYISCTSKRAGVTRRVTADFRRLETLSRAGFHPPL
jgi:hypothetical protein